MTTDNIPSFPAETTERRDPSVPIRVYIAGGCRTIVPADTVRIHRQGKVLIGDAILTKAFDVVEVWNDDEWRWGWVQPDEALS